MTTTQPRAIPAGLLLAGLVNLLCCDSSGNVTVAPGDLLIVCPVDANAVTVEAVEELRTHIQLLAETDVPVVKNGPVPAGAYPVHVGSPPPGQVATLAPEEARWVTTPEATYLYGDDAPGRYGTLFAVYSFLEDQLAVRWTEPGDRGVCYRRRQLLQLETGEFSWHPTLVRRHIRTGIRLNRPPVVKSHVAEFSSFAVSKEAHNQAVRDVVVWSKRMRMGGHESIAYGHAFTEWWQRFGETHPEYFALNKYGKREPEVPESASSSADNPLYAHLPHFQTIKLCPGNPEVAKRIIGDWLANPRRSKYVNVCENDSPPPGFCRCRACTTLDRLEDGEQFGVYAVPLTDRYVYLLNAVARAAKRHDPDAWAVTYAYNESEQPPRELRLDQNVVLGVVPTTVELPKLRQFYESWRACGATKMFLRPNIHHYYFTTTIPMGFEKQMFDAFQVACEYGVISTDYDSLMHHWPVTGIADYIQTRAFSDPSKPFEYWEEHYCSGYGPAADEVKSYFRYWRHELWDRRLLPDIEGIIVRGRYYNFVRGVMWGLDKYYRAEDFDRTDAILEQASARDLTEPERARLQQLVLANRHARLVFNAVVTRGLDKFEHSKELLEFRVREKDVLNLRWLPIFGLAKRFGDLTGIKTAERLKAFPLPWIQTPLAWRFCLDPQDVGLEQQWQKRTWEDTSDWDRLRTDFAWENPYDGEDFPSAALRQALKDYDGIGWYTTRMRVPPDWRGRVALLYFGAVDESCWVFVNGQEAGKHLFEKSDDWSTPFTIRIDPLVDWDRGMQSITVRVEDRGGAGGIWKRVWLVSQPPDE